MVLAVPPHTHADHMYLHFRILALFEMLKMNSNYELHSRGGSDVALLALVVLRNENGPQLQRRSGNMTKEGWSC